MTAFTKRLGRVFLLVILLSALFRSDMALAASDALKDYLKKDDAAFHWQRSDRPNVLHLRSQQWRGITWQHELRLFYPTVASRNEATVLFVGSSTHDEEDFRRCQWIADQSGLPTAYLSGVPNEPLFERSEDGLIAYSFDQFLASKDSTWPLLFPMVRSVTAAMTALEQYGVETGQHTNKFILTGASKRAWTSYLTGAVDRRVIAIAPMVFDMLNMAEQVRWARKMYGADSEKIKDYTKLGLTDRIDDPGVAQLREWVDPFQRRDELHIPTLILLGSNDPYWVADSLHLYWNALLGQKYVYYSPNYGHSVDDVAIDTLAKFAARVAARAPMPLLKWKIKEEMGRRSLHLSSSEEMAQVRLWKTSAATRDLRNAKWSASSLPPARATAEVPLESETAQYHGYIVEVVLMPSAMTLSTELIVIAPISK